MGDAISFVFFGLIYKWLTDRITTFGSELLSRAMIWATSIALILVTLWVLIQGFRILSGRSRDSMMAMVLDMSRIGVIVSAATLMAVGSVNLQSFFGTGLSSEINHLVTGSDESPASSIDKNLAYAQIASAAIAAVPAPGEDASVAMDRTVNRLMAGLGAASPAMTGAALLLMYQVALALFIGLGPIFILCLIFEATKPMFFQWLKYGIGTLFSLAVLNFVMSLVLQLTLKVAIGLWTARIISGLTGLDTEGFNNQALQQGGLGLLMTVLLISTPPMAAAFFGGTIGQFYFQSAFGANRGGGQMPDGSQSPYRAAAAPQSAPPKELPTANVGGYGIGRSAADPTSDTVKPASQIA